MKKNIKSGPVVQLRTTRTANFSIQRHTIGPVMVITSDPPHNPVGFRCSNGGIWCEYVMRSPLRQSDT